MNIEVGDLVLWRFFNTCKVEDIKNGLFKIRPYCDAFVWVHYSDIRLLHKKGFVRTGKGIKYA